MSSMKVILTEDVQSLGYAGEIVNVKGGYGRNYLLPRNKAMVADSKNVKAMEHAKFIAEHRVKKITGEFQGLADKMAAEKITLAHKVGEEGKLFGAVTALEIAKALSEKGFEIDHRKIGLEKPIKALGEFTVSVKLHKDVSADVKVEVVAE